MGKATTSEALEGLARRRTYWKNNADSKADRAPPSRDFRNFAAYLDDHAILSRNYSISSSTATPNTTGRCGNQTVSGVGCGTRSCFCRNNNLRANSSLPAAYGFSRYRFHGRKLGLFMFLIVDVSATIRPILHRHEGLRLAQYLCRLGRCIFSHCPSSCVWLMKGFFDTYQGVEEAARQMAGRHRSSSPLLLTSGSSGHMPVLFPRGLE